MRHGPALAPALLGLWLGCLPVPTPLEGKACDGDHPCGLGLSCVEGRCWAEPPPGALDAPEDAGGTGVVQPPRDFDAGADAGASDAGAGDAGASECPRDGGAPAQESDCADGRDNDCDGLADCQDPSCSLRSCDGARSAAVCCPDGSGRGACRDLSADPKHCGACGVSCSTGRACNAVSVNGVRSGLCGCSSDGDCPQPGAGGLAEDQNCIQNRCECDSATECGSGQRCTRAEGLGAPGFCHY